MSILARHPELYDDAELIAVHLKEQMIETLRDRTPRGSAVGTVYLHSPSLLVDVDLPTLAAGLVAHMPDCAAVLSGVHSEGMPWMVMCRIAAADYRFVDATDPADAAVRRALTLSGYSYPERSHAPLLAAAIKDEYWRAEETDVRG